MPSTLQRKGCEKDWQLKPTHVGLVLPKRSLSLNDLDEESCLDLVDAFTERGRFKSEVALSHVGNVAWLFRVSANVARLILLGMRKPWRLGVRTQQEVIDYFTRTKVFNNPGVDGPPRH